MVHPVILAGGSGERFWPLSRQRKPKQFLTLNDSGLSLLQATADRLSPANGAPEALIVVTANEHHSQVLELLIENLLGEPVVRDTTAAILYAALNVHFDDPDAVMGVFPADHRINDQAAFQATLARAIEYARAHDVLVTLGIELNYPATGYGYIEYGESDSAFAATPVHRVQRFTEKPDSETAAGFLHSGNYLLNSGMFIWQVRSILDAFARHVPDLYVQMSEAAVVRGGLRWVYTELPKISIDYSVLEHAENVVVIPAAFGWDDLGDWNTLERLLKADSNNVVMGWHVGLDTGGAILYTTDGDDLIATTGLEDTVVRSGDVKLVFRKDRTQAIKKGVQQLKLNLELESFA